MPPKLGPDAKVTLVDAAGAPLAVGGGTQYADGTVVATPTGTAVMWNDAGTERVVSATKPLPVGLQTTLSETNDSVTGHIGGYDKLVDLTITRAAAGTYVAGEEIADTTGTAGQRTLAGCGRVNGGSGSITGLVLIVNENPAVTPSIEVFLFDAIPATAGDSTTFAPTDAEMNACIGTITLAASIAKIGTTGTTGNMVYDSGPLDIGFVCAGGSTALYFLMVTRTGYTPQASSTYKLRARVRQN